MNRPSTKTIISTSLALVAFILIAGGILVHKDTNREIKSAMQSFADFARENPSLAPSPLCKGGFIDIETPGLQEISDRIVNNRILRAKPLEYATTQDEAGISCLTSTSSWMLFTALNQKNPDGSAHHCIDSTGKSGSYGIDHDSALCGQ